MVHIDKYGRPIRDPKLGSGVGGDSKVNAAAGGDMGASKNIKIGQLEDMHRAIQTGIGKKSAGDDAMMQLAKSDAEEKVDRQKIFQRYRDDGNPERHSESRVTFLIQRTGAKLP